MKFIYYAGMITGAFLVFRFEGVAEVAGSAILVVSIVAETARELTHQEAP